MSVTGPAQSAVDWVNPVNWGPWGPLAVSQGGARPATSAGHRRGAPASSNAAAMRGCASGFAHSGFAGAGLGAFDAARRRASNGGGRRGWNGRRRAL